MVLLICISLQISQAQSNQRTIKQSETQTRCASYEAELEMRAQYPELGTVEEFEARIAPLVEEYKERMANGERLSTINLPIVYHVIHNGTAVGSGSNISGAYVNSQNDQLNNDYRKASGTSGDNTDPRGADSEVEFCLATEDPSGTTLAEPGINRINRNDEGWNTPPYARAYLEGTVKPGSIWDPEKYVNVWIVQLEAGLLGYAQFPSNTGLGGLDTDGGPANTDGVVITYTSVGSTTNAYPGGAPYNMGRTLTHELGHWLGLRHIWGDAECGTDYCDDTPIQTTSSGGNCPSTTTCDGQADMTKNYMDYSNDGCMNIFTNDQKARIRAVLATGRSALLSSDIPCNVSGYDPIISYFTVPVGNDECPGGSVSFTNGSYGSGITYAWDFGDGTTANVPSPNKTYNNSGDFDVTLTISKGGQSDSYARLVNVSDVVRNNNLNNGTLAVYSSDGSGYIGGHNNYDDLAKAEYFAALPNGEQVVSADFLFLEADGNANAPVVFNVWDNTGTNGKPGTVIATETVTIGDITVNEWFRVDFSDVTISGPIYIGFELNNVNGTSTAVYTNTDGETSPSTAWELWSDDNTWYSFDTDEAEGWGSETSMAITANFSCPVTAAPETDFVASASAVCQNSPVSFNDLSTNQPDTWAWTFGDGGTSDQQNPTHTYTAAGTYTVTLTANNSEGSDAESKTDYIVVQPEPTGFAGNTSDDIICVGESVTLTMSNTFSATYSWEEDGTTIANSASTSVSPTETATYTALCDDGVCSASSDVTVTVSVVETPTISVSGNVLTASSSSSGDYQWFLDGGAIAGATSSSFTATEGGGYTVTLTDANDCSATSTATNLSLTAVIDNALDQAISVYPNPVSDLLTINFSNADITDLSLSVIDVTGKTLITEDVTRQVVQLDLSQLSAGVYLIRVENAESKISIKEIIKD